MEILFDNWNDYSASYLVFYSLPYKLGELFTNDSHDVGEKICSFRLKQIDLGNDFGCSYAFIYQRVRGQAPAELITNMKDQINERLLLFF